MSRIWNSKNVQECLNMMMEGEPVHENPFFMGDMEFRAADIIFEYTEEELQEITRCASDVVYFAEKYCHVMTDEGIRTVKLREYQKRILKYFQEERFIIGLASRQIGKTITSSIFMAWYLSFHTDRNAMIIANKGATAAEIVDKTKVIFRNLPFFLKPGVSVNNVMTMRFDNGCRLMSQSTTKNTAIGFTLHLVYMDEFAHIHPNFLEPFYRSVYPTLSSSKISKVIITSTANGMNKFYQLYTDALEEKNEYKTFRVDWWEVPGRDERWKKQEIANLGSEELFNQEYGNQFLAASKLLLDSKSITKLQDRIKQYVWREIADFEEIELDYSKLTWSPEFDLDSVTEDDKIIFSIDLADGIGGDYTVINIYKLAPLSHESINKMKIYKSESDFFGLVQIGLFRSNSHTVDDVAKILATLSFRIFNPDQLKIILEINFKGDLLIEKLSQERDFYEEIFLHSMHSQASKAPRAGLKIQRGNKVLFCHRLKYFIERDLIKVEEFNTVQEMSSFGLNHKNAYTSQLGHDDIAMTCVNTTAYFDSLEFYEQVEEIYDKIDQETKELINWKLENNVYKEESIDSDFLKLLNQ